QPRGRRVRGVFAYGLGVVATEDRVARDEDLPRGDVLAVRGGEVVPVEDDGGRAVLHGRGRRLRLGEVARRLQAFEEVDALADVVQGAALGEVGHHDA